MKRRQLGKLPVYNEYCMIHCILYLHQFEMYKDYWYSRIHTVGTTVCSHTCSQFHISAIIHNGLWSIFAHGVFSIYQYNVFLDQRALFQFRRRDHVRIHNSYNLCFNILEGSCCHVANKIWTKMQARQSVHTPQPICNAGHNLIPQLITQQDPFLLVRAKIITRSVNVELCKLYQIK